MDHKEDREMLRKNGFAEVEVRRLSKLRREYIEEGKLQTLANQRRLEFIRWLYHTGKLSDQIA